MCSPGYVHLCVCVCVCVCVYVYDVYVCSLSAVCLVLLCVVLYCIVCLFFVGSVVSRICHSLASAHVSAECFLLVCTGGLDLG